MTEVTRMRGHTFQNKNSFQKTNFDYCNIFYGSFPYFIFQSIYFKLFSQPAFPDELQHCHHKSGCNEHMAKSCNA